MAQDRRYEHHLDRQKVVWRYEPALPLAVVDVGASLNNQARLAKLDDNVIERYRTAMEAGAVFPPLVGFYRGNRLVLIDGNHRFTAYTQLAEQQGITDPVWDAYIVETGDRFVVDVLTRSWNIIEGVAPPTDQIMAQALGIIDQYNITVKEAAERFYLDPKRLGVFQRVREAEARIRQVGLGAVREYQAAPLKADALVKLNAITSDVVFKPAALLVQSSRMPHADIQRLVSDIRAQRSEQEQLTVIDRWRKAPAVRAVEPRVIGSVARPRQTERQAFYRLVRDLHALATKHERLEQLQLTESQDRIEARKCWSQARSAMDRLFGMQDGYDRAATTRV